MASEWQTAFVVSHKMPWYALLTAVNYNKSLEKLQDFFICSRPRPTPWCIVKPLIENKVTWLVNHSPIQGSSKNFFRTSLVRSADQLSPADSPIPLWQRASERCMLQGRPTSTRERERERFICMKKKTAGNQKGKCPSTLVPILNQIIN